MTRAAGRSEGRRVFPAGLLLCVAAGLLLVSTLLLAWTRSGNGNLASGADLGRLLAENGEPAAAVAVYGVACAGGLLIALSGVPGTMARISRVLLGVAVLAMIASLSQAGLIPLHRWGAAPLASAFASLLVFIRDVPYRRHR